MKELKFRVWSDFWEKYADFEAELHMDGSVDADFEDDTGIPHHENTDLIIELCTGLKDKNGKEIYEGDIVDYNDDGGFIGVVKYDAPEFYIESGDVNIWAFLKGAPHQMVIGNIHENPELLRDKAK